MERLSADKGFQAMVKVSECFSYKNQTVERYKVAQGGQRPWHTLAEALQGDEIERRRIQFYKEVSTQWMTAQGVNVLDMCELNEACLPARENRENGRTKILSYFKKNISVPRPCFPKAPSGFEWGSGKRSAHFERKDKNEAKVPHANKDQLVSLGHGDTDSAEATPGSNFVVQEGLKKGLWVL